MLVITNWNGRLGNNIMQIIRAIHYAKINFHSEINFPDTKYLRRNKLYINIEKANAIIIRNDFFYLNKLGLEDPCPEQMKKYFIEFVKPMLIVNAIETLNNTLHIHIRSGDTFSNNPHGKYLPPPLIYYKTIIESQDWDDIKVVFEDNINPCVIALKNSNYKNIELISDSLQKDLSILGSSKNLVVGPGTFGLLAYFLSEELESLYIPRYVLNEMPKGEWGVKLNIVELPNYIKCGEWRNTAEQSKILVNYTIP